MMNFLFEILLSIGLRQLLVAGASVGIWAYSKHKQKTNVRIMALNLVRGVPLTAKEKETMLDLHTPPPPEGASPSSWWSRLRRHDVQFCELSYLLTHIL